MKKILYILGGLCVFIVLFVALFYWFNGYIYNQKQEDGIAAYQGTLSGEYVCLPYKDAIEPQSDECVHGLKTDVGEYYAIDFSLTSQEYPSLTPGDRIIANGRVTPIELLSTDYWQRYPVEGVFSITDSLQVNE